MSEQEQQLEKQVEKEEEVKVEEAKDQKEEILAQCLGCHKKQPVVEIEEVVTKNHHRRISGKCAECGRRVSSFVKAKKADQ